ncbi:hypothetical protein D3C84_1091550 [compost metagenome]
MSQPMNKSRLADAWAAAKTSAKRELGLFVVMMIFAVCVAVVALPVIYIMFWLPDWTWWIWLVAGGVWFIFGDTITSAVRAYRG